jgi:Rrf2 family protein
VITLIGLMQIPRRVDYGLRAIIYLSVQDPEKCCSIKEIAKQQGAPKKFLEKIIQDLMRCRLIRSQRGARGGYTLARSPEQISFYDVIAAIEGPIAVNAWDAASKYSADSNKQLQSSRRNRQSLRSSNQRS